MNTNFCIGCKWNIQGRVCKVVNIKEINNVIVDCDSYEKEKYSAKSDDKVNSPNHYKQGNRETIEIIKDITGTGFNDYIVGNIIKYISRYKYKNGVEDLKKAKWYLERLIAEVENIDNKTTK